MTLIIPEFKAGDKWKGKVRQDSHDLQDYESCSEASLANPLLNSECGIGIADF
jgi:hypothetical protein